MHGFILRRKCVLIFIWLQVSRTYEIFKALMEYEGDMMSGNLSLSDVITVLISVNPVFEVKHQLTQETQWPVFPWTLLSNNFSPELVPKVRSWFTRVYPLFELLMCTYRPQRSFLHIDHCSCTQNFPALNFCWPFWKLWPFMTKLDRWWCCCCCCCDWLGHSQTKLCSFLWLHALLAVFQMKDLWIRILKKTGNIRKRQYYTPTLNFPPWP